MENTSQYTHDISEDFFSDFEAWAARPAKIDVDTLGWDPFGGEAA